MSTNRYASWVRHLHWLVFALVAGALILIYMRAWVPKRSDLRVDLDWAHMQIGIVVLLVMLPRLVVRACNFAPPPIHPPLPRWQDASAKLVHLTLYWLLIAVPILGITNRMWDPASWNFFGIPMPHVAHRNESLANQIERIHQTLGNVLMYLAAAHALLALSHHFIHRDDTLRRMLPASKTGRLAGDSCDVRPQGR